MTAAFAEINWIAVVVATVIGVVVGGVYFALLVPRHYLRVLGREAGESLPSGPVRAAGPLVCLLVTVLTSAVLVAALGLRSAGDALVFGLVVGVGYLLAMTFQIALNPNFPHPIRYGVLNAPYFLTISLVTSFALVLI